MLDYIPSSWSSRTFRNGSTASTSNVPKLGTSTKRGQQDQIELCKRGLSFAYLKSSSVLRGSLRVFLEHTSLSTQLTMLVHTVCILAVSCSSVVTSSPIFDSPEIVKYSVTGDVQSPSLLSEVESRGHVTRYDVTNNAMNGKQLLKVLKRGVVC